MSNIEQLDHFLFDADNPLYKTATERFVFNDGNLIDYEWIRKQIDYIDGLSERQKHVLRAYTIYGDRFVNPFLRNTLTEATVNTLVGDMLANREDVFHYQQLDAGGVPLSDPSYSFSVFAYIPSFLAELNTIIQSSPPLTRPIKVFRGIKNRSHFDAIAHTGTITYREFISTSMYLPSAMSDAFIGSSCCLLEMTLCPGTPCIFTARVSRRRNEFEITLGMASRHAVVCPGVKFALDDMDHYADTDIFMNPVKYNLREIMTAELHSIP